MNVLSTWAISAYRDVLHPEPALFETAVGAFKFICLSTDSLWVKIELAEQQSVAFRAVFCGGKSLNSEKVTEVQNRVKIQLTSELVQYCATKVPGQDFEIYVDYPTLGIRSIKDKSSHFNVLGNNRLTCKLMIIRGDQDAVPEIKVNVNGKVATDSELTKEKNISYHLLGNSHINIAWSPINSKKQ